MEVPSFLRQLVKETEKMVTFFFKGGRRESGTDVEYFENEEDVGSPYLKRPILEKDTEEGGSKWGVNYGMASMQAGEPRWRIPTPACQRWPMPCQAGAILLCTMDMRGERWLGTAPDTCWISFSTQVLTDY